MVGKKLTDIQQRFLDALFGDAEGDVVRAKRQAGYSENTTVKEVTDSLSEEIADYTRKYLGAGAAKAAYYLVKSIGEPNGIGVRVQVDSSKDILDRAGFGKVDKVEVSGSNAVFLLPAKDAKED